MLHDTKCYSSEKRQGGGEGSSLRQNAADRNPNSFTNFDRK